MASSKKDPIRSNISRKKLVAKESTAKKIRKN